MVKFAKGSIIQTSEPFAAVVDWPQRARVCANCFKTSLTPLKNCIKCKFVYYCDRECQVKDWRKFHKHGECTIYQNCANLVAERKQMGYHTLFRIIVRIHTAIKTNNLGDKQFKCFDGSSRSFSDLMSHKDIISGMEEHQEVTKFIRDVLERTGLKLTADEMYDIYGRLRTNSFNLQDAKFEPIGVGLYIENSIFDHSCDANAIGVFEDSTMKVQALKDIAEDEKITLCYTDTSLSTKDRREDLMDKYHFHCECVKCS